MAAPTSKKSETRIETAVSPRLIIVGGGKGGVGKSTFARALVDYYDLRGVQCAAFDGDIENPTLSRFLNVDESAPRAIPLASQTADGFELLVEHMESRSAPRLVADLGAGTQRHAAEFERLLGLGRVAQRLGYEPVLVWLLTPAKDSIALLGDAAETHAGWRLVLARAVYAVGDWRLWDGSNVKRKVDALCPEEMSVPLLKARAFTALDRKDLRFLDATDNLAIIDAEYASSWFRTVCASFDASAVLSVSPAPFPVPAR